MYYVEKKRRNNNKTYSPAIAIVTIGAVGAVLPTPANYYVWGAGAAGVAVAKALEIA